MDNQDEKSKEVSQIIGEVRYPSIGATKYPSIGAIKYRNLGIIDTKETGVNISLNIPVLPDVDILSYCPIDRRVGYDSIIDSIIDSILKNREEWNMLQSMVFLKYTEIFKVDLDTVDIWFPNGRGSVRIRFKDKTELFFTYENDNNWKLETKESFINSLKNKKREGK